MKQPGVRPSGDAGIMLVELLVGILLVGIVGGLASDAIVSALRSQAYVTTRSADLNSLRQVMQRMTRDLRQATIVTPPTRALLVVTLPGGTGTRTYAATGNTLTANGATVLSNLDSAAASPVFSYTGSAGYAAAAGVDPVFCTSTALPSGSYDPACIGSVTIHLSTLVPRHPDVSISDTVDLRNAGSG